MRSDLVEAVLLGMVVVLAAFLENDGIVRVEDLILFASQGHGLNPKSVDDKVLVLDDLL